MWFLNRIANPVVRAVLRSRLHPLLSRRLILLRVVGRRTGRVVELPVGYREEGGRLRVRVGAPERKRWWRNIDGPAPVTVLLRGRPIPGTAQRIEGPGGEVGVEITLEAPG